MKKNKILLILTVFIITLISLTGCYNEPTKYTVSFETFGGSKVNDIKTTRLQGTIIPSKKDFHFVNWYDKPDFSSKPVTFPLTITKDTKLYAKFEEGIFKYKINEDNTSVTILGLHYCPQNKDIVFTKQLKINNTYYNVTNINNTIDKSNYINSISFEKNFVIDNLYINDSNIKTIDFTNLTNIDNVSILGASSLEKIILPNTINSISEGLFIGLNSIKNIDIPDSVKIINKNAFTSLLSLENINFTSNSKLEKICSNSFVSLFSLKEITIPISVKIIEENAFKNCYNLEKIIINCDSDSINLGKIYNSEKTKIYVKNQYLNDFKLKYKNLSFVGF